MGRHLGATHAPDGRPGSGARRDWNEPGPDGAEGDPPGLWPLACRGCSGLRAGCVRALAALGAAPDCGLATLRAQASLGADAERIAAAFRLLGIG